MRIVVNKQWRVYLDLGRAGSLSLQLYRTYYRLLHMRVAVNSHALHIYKKNRIAPLLCIFKTTNNRVFFVVIVVVATTVVCESVVQLLLLLLL